jgi:hypothetical protein
VTVTRAFAIHVRPTEAPIPGARLALKFRLPADWSAGVAHVQLAVRRDPALEALDPTGTRDLSASLSLA